MQSKKAAQNLSDSEASSPPAPRSVGGGAGASDKSGSSSSASLSDKKKSKKKDKKKKAAKKDKKANQDKKERKHKKSKKDQSKSSSNGGSGKKSEDRHFAAEDRKIWDMRLKDPPLTQKAIAHWRHWKPGKIKSDVPETQREIEKNLRIRWGERILSHVLPRASRLQAMKALTGNIKTEAMDLLRQSRFRSLRVHCLRYERMKRMGFTAMMSASSSTCSEKKRQRRTRWRATEQHSAGSTNTSGSWICQQRGGPQEEERGSRRGPREDSHEAPTQGRSARQDGHLGTERTVPRGPPGCQRPRREPT